MGTLDGPTNTSPARDPEAREVRLRDASTVRSLLDPLTRQVLAIFCGRSVETAQAARELGWSTERTAHHVARLHRAGVLREVSRREHSGRAVVTWTAPQVLRGSLDLLPEADVTAVFDEVDAAGRKPFLQALARAAVQRGLLSWDVVVHRKDGEEGGLRLSVSPEGTRWLPGDATERAEQAPPVVLSWLPLALNADQARRLQQTLLDLAAEQPVATGAPTHLCGLFLTPL
ncbi:hypothetical protein SAMN06264364_13634 [Quadrisphaera granulorum]|uniref:Helix-turn-helix protein n=1 Tax=Quadrisphaera granulorum TaxID=317664 RepID=A0A315ZR60_9ACTN|nr:hypothetical protein [Quadrisphaera granulorum]PWJ47603.1 hypothetical protein BXY45_13634 [Quadrisphaera granulorum]SZE98733.1 hypothetical protein SAMN06264364_13634 [Quadrisphaera granulorum]